MHFHISVKTSFPTDCLACCRRHDCIAGNALLRSLPCLELPVRGIPGIDDATPSPVFFRHCHLNMVFKKRTQTKPSETKKQNKNKKKKTLPVSQNVSDWLESDLRERVWWSQSSEITSMSSVLACCVATRQRLTCWLPFLFCCDSGDSSSSFWRLCLVLLFWNHTFTWQKEEELKYDLQESTV